TAPSARRLCSLRFRRTIGASDRRTASRHSRPPSWRPALTGSRYSWFSFSSPSHRMAGLAPRSLVTTGTEADPRGVWFMRRETGLYRHLAGHHFSPPGSLLLVRAEAPQLTAACGLDQGLDLAPGVDQGVALRIAAVANADGVVG